MNWIKMRVNLDTDPDIIGISADTNLDEFSVIGRLWKLWSWADQHLLSGNAIRVTEVTLDRLVNCSGFAAAMREVGWLEGRDSALTFPRFDRHNGQTAKKRALTSNRQDAYRSRNSDNANNASVTQHALPEKRREDKNSTHTHPLLAQVLAYADHIGCHHDTATRFWNHYESTGWIDKNGFPVRKWQNKLAVWKADEGAKTYQLAAKRQQTNAAHQHYHAQGNRNVGTANEGRSSQYEGVGRV